MIVVRNILKVGEDLGVVCGEEEVARGDAMLRGVLVPELRAVLGPLEVDGVVGVGFGLRLALEILGVGVGADAEGVWGDSAGLAVILIMVGYSSTMYANSDSTNPLEYQNEHFCSPNKHRIKIK